MKQFGRTVEVVISELNGSGIEVKNLTIAFNVMKDGSSTENKADCKIYNLNDYNRGWIDRAETRKDKPIVIIIKAGYGNCVKQIYKGDVKEANSELIGSDWITSISAKDGNSRNLTVKVAQSFKDGTLLQAINYLADQLGFAKKVIKDIPAIKYQAGISLSGYARDELDNLCRAYDLHWFVEDGTFNIMPQLNDSGQVAIVLNTESGLIGSPKKTEKGVECVSLINGDYKIGRLVQMESKMFKKANYKVIELVHSGNSREGDFYSKLTLQKL